jgi:zinc D-Ala-D-Ala carboxypeptidase
MIPSGWPKHFSRAELLRSDRALRLGIPNDPTPQHEDNLRALAWHVLQPLRDALGPIQITSGYRSPLLNSKTPGASKTSQHSLGQAADLVPARGATFTTAAIFHHILTFLPFDQLIWEFGDAKNPAWVHVSFTQSKRRNSILVARKGPDGKTQYAPWKRAA